MLPVGEILIPSVRSEVTLASSSWELRGYIIVSRPHELTVTAPSPDGVNGDSIPDLLKPKTRDIAPYSQAS